MSVGTLVLVVDQAYVDDLLKIGIMGLHFARVSHIQPHRVIVNPIVRNVLAVILGFVVGSAVNMTLVNVGPAIIPLPEGADVSDMESLRASMKLFTPANFLAPFLAHALGTLCGAFFAAKIAASHSMKIAIGIGVFFLMGGIAAASMLGGPTWFIVADLVLAYIPMGLLGGILARKMEHEATTALSDEVNEGAR